MIFLSIKDPLAPQIFFFLFNSPNSLWNIDKGLKSRKPFQVKERKRLCWIPFISVRYTLRFNLEDFINKYSQLPKFYKLSVIFIHMFSVCNNINIFMGQTWKKKSQGPFSSRKWLPGRQVQDHIMLSRVYTFCTVFVLTSRHLYHIKVTALTSAHRTFRNQNELTPTVKTVSSKLQQSFGWLLLTLTSLPLCIGPTYLHFSKIYFISEISFFSSINRNTEYPRKIIFKVFMQLKENNSLSLTYQGYLIFV